MEEDPKGFLKSYLKEWKLLWASIIDANDDKKGKQEGSHMESESLDEKKERRRMLFQEVEKINLEIENLQKNKVTDQNIYSQYLDRGQHLLKEIAEIDKNLA